MGFSTCLQGASAHEALLARQDAELRLLENMRRCVALRIKCDREYAVALNSVVIQAQKLEHCHHMSGSLVGKAWQTITQETEFVSRLIKQTADSVAIEALELLSSLVNEKRASRKYYQEEYQQMCSQLQQVEECVNRAKNEYEKALEAFKVVRSKMDDSKGWPKPGRRTEENNEKLMRAVQRMYLAHNNYVFHLREAAEFERDYRTGILPALLEYQETVQGECILLWKQVLELIAHEVNFCTKEHRESQKRIESSVKDIIGNVEYKEFLDKNKTSPPDPVAFIFDYHLLSEPGLIEKLRPNEIVFDPLTQDDLRDRETDLMARLTTSEAVLQEKELQLSKCEQDLAQSERQDRISMQVLVLHRAADMLRKDLTGLRCQINFLKGQLNFLHQHLQPGAVGQVAEDNTGKKTLKLVDRIRRPFLKKAVSTKMLDKEDDSSDASPILGNPLQEPPGNVMEEDWFHGVLPREEVVRLLQNEGDFLVRETLRNDERQIVLSIAWGGHKHFIIQTSPEGYFRFEGPAFPTIRELVGHLIETGTPVTSKSGAMLRNPISRERWELNHNDVILIEKIGRGNFGDVYKARLRGNGSDVAVKTCRMALPDEQRKKFLQEGRILKQYEHPNIVKFIGICVQKQPIMIVMELVAGGSLLSFLRSKSNPLQCLDMLKMCVDIAGGMEYLESKNCIHRDLAARNCLVGKDRCVKISDFGMSREEEEYIVSDGMKQIPIKWTAPEALNFGKYTSLCDVWSYGVLTWEVFSRGSTPYSGLSNSKAREMIDSGYRMPAPEGTPEAMYRLMLWCWEYEPEMRPHFMQVHESVSTITIQEAGPT